jgi:hypothetical protein
LSGPLDSVSYRDDIAAIAMNAANAVAHCPLLPADTPLDHVRNASEMLNADARFLTERVGAGHAEPPRPDRSIDHDPGPACCSDSWLHHALDVAPSSNTRSRTSRSRENPASRRRTSAETFGWSIADGLIVRERSGRR